MLRQTIIKSMWSCASLLVFALFLLCTCVSTSTSTNTQVTPKFNSYNVCSMETLTNLSEMQKDERDFWFHLLRPMLIVRVSGTPGSEKVQKHITDILSSDKMETKWTIETDTFRDTAPPPHGEKQFTNIIASQEPKASKVLLLACHFDSKEMGKEKFIGATDSAVPCAILLDLAVRLDKLLPKKKNNDISLQLVFFDGEEAFNQWTDTDSLYGARHLANQWKVKGTNRRSRLEEIEAFILLDLIGGKNMQFWDFFSAQTSKLFEKLKKTENRMREKSIVRTDVHTMFQNNRPSITTIQDDHVPFHMQGVPILHLISFPFPEQWHQKSDTEKNLQSKDIFYFNHIFRVFVASYLKLPVMCKK